MKNKTLSIFARTIPYCKHLKQATRHTNAALLWMQLDFWFDKYQDGFYKRLTEDENFDGFEQERTESWKEELAFSQDEFYTAFSKLGIRYKSETAYKNAGEDIFKGMLYCSVYVRSIAKGKKTGRTFYYRNHEVCDAILDMINLGKIDQVRAYLKNPDASLLLGRQQEFTFEDIKKTEIEHFIEERQYKHLSKFQKLPSDNVWSKLKTTISNLDEVLDEVEGYCAKNPSYTTKRKDLAAVIRAFAKKMAVYPVGFKAAYIDVFTSLFGEAPMLDKNAASKMESIRDKIKASIISFRQSAGNDMQPTQQDTATAFRLFLEKISAFETRVESWSLPLLDYNYQTYYLKIKNSNSTNGRQKTDNGISLSEDEKAVLNGNF